MNTSVALDPTAIPFHRWRPPTLVRPRGTLLFVSGGSQEKDFRFKTEPLSNPLSRIGFDVFAFDYRGNVEGANFFSFGLHDRIEDTKKAIEYMRVLGSPPYSILGLSMGGHVAVRAVAETDGGNLFENVILIASAAYAKAASRPGVLFGPGEGRFRDIIRQTDSWMTSDAFEAAETIDANLLLFRFRSDVIVTPKITAEYYKRFGRVHSRDTAKWKKRFFDIAGGHTTLTDPNPDRIQQIIAEIADFIPQSPTF